MIEGNMMMRERGTIGMCVLNTKMARSYKVDRVEKRKRSEI